MTTPVRVCGSIAHVIHESPDNESLAKDASPATTEAERVARDGLDNAQRKLYRT